MGKKIILTKDELHRYQLLPHDFYYCKIGLNDQEISEEDETKFENLVLQDADISETHHNFLKWSFALLKNKPTRVKMPKEYLKAVNAASTLNSILEKRINSIYISGTTSDSIIKSFVLPIIDEQVESEILRTIQQYIKSLSNEKIPNRGPGRPHGEEAPGRDEYLSSLAYNLTEIIGCTIHRAKEILFKYGYLLGFWKDKVPEGKYHNDQAEYRGKKVNKYFTHSYEGKSSRFDSPY